MTLTSGNGSGKRAEDVLVIWLDSLILTRRIPSSKGQRRTASTPSIRKTDSKNVGSELLLDLVEVLLYGNPRRICHALLAQCRSHALPLC